RLEEQGRIANIASQNYLRNIQPSNNVNAANIANHANRNRSNAANRGNAGNRTNASNRGRPRNHVNAAQIAAIDRELENAALAANLENAANQACVENAVNEANESANLANADNNVAGPSQAPPRAAVDGDGSRPSSAQSARSDDIPDSRNYASRAYLRVRRQNSVHKGRGGGFVPFCIRSLLKRRGLPMVTCSVIDVMSVSESLLMSERSQGGGPAAAAAAAPRGGGGGGRGRERELLSPLLRVPMERGWRRELVYRATFDSQHRRNADIYYYTPQGKKLRSTREVSEQLEGTGLTLDNFSFFKEPLGIADPEKETIRDAKMNRRVESPVPAPPVAPPIIEGKRTPKPKAPKGASPEPSTPKSPSAKIKVKSVGSRLAVNSPSTALTKKSPTVAKKSSENHNAGGWKRPRVGKIRGRVLNGSPSPSAGGTAPAPVSAPAPAPASASAVSPPRKRGRPKSVEVDYITAFFNKAHGLKYNVVIQIFQYLGMRDLGHCSRVCKQWHQIAGTPALWRHVRLKNSFVSDWAALCALLRSRGTKWLDMKKMLVPPNDTHFWDQFSMHIGSVESLERLELCRCPARAVEAALRALPRVVAFSALAIRDMAFDPGALAHAPRLRDLRIKSMAGLTLAGPLAPLADLTHLVHLSLTSIKFSAQELECNVVDVIGHLRQLESLELGECTFHAEFAGVVSRLRRLRRLRLERGTEQCAAPALLHALSNLPMLSALELINVDVKVGFDDALAECTNIERLLIIPTYVSQSATTNKQVLSGVLRLKDSLTHLMWGVTIELLRVTELFIDQCEQGMDGRRRDIGECIPVLKPVPGCRLPDQRHVTGPPQVEIMPLPTLQRLLSAQLPNTKLKLLRIPFHATWRQSLADFQNPPRRRIT
ncbi:hypothetical protein ACJJTC_003804, partial [Scirpophaga incertulas]